jgi:hypothetical protein
MFSRRPVLYVVAVLAVAFLSAAPSHAATVTYADFASWSAAVSGVTTVTIPEPLDTLNLYDYFGSGTASVTYSGVVFSTSALLSDGNFFNIGTGYSFNPAPVLSSQEQSTGVANILISLPGNVTGFALHYGTSLGSNVTFTLSNGDIVTQGSTGVSAYSVPEFFGVTDNTPFDSVLVTSPDNVLNLNNVSFGSAGATGVPEPAAWLLLTTGLAGLLGYGRRRARSA